MNNTIDTINELGFTDEDITECLERKGLLSIELEFTMKCNFRCRYCYSNAGNPAENELNIDEIKSVILQAKKLGAKKIILLGGGEPLLYEGFEEVVEYIASNGLQQVLFTNGALINEGIARFLYQNKIPVVIKHNSLNPEVQDMLADANGAFKRINKGLKILIETGYPDKNATLGIQSVICKQNIDEIPSMWIWARERGIIPYFEMLTYQGRAKVNMDLFVPVSEIKAIFERLERIDNSEFGIEWDSRPTIAAFSCKRHLYSCLINSQGYVQPCTGVDLFVGNIREIPLAEILESSPVIMNLRNIQEKIEGPCKACEHNKDCYGCRGNAYQITGNYLASDPSCWHCEKESNESPTHICQQ
ncbi:MAG: radical SAM/SPASM domain-containing protein [Candidatus Brocadiales bacterium]